MLLLLVLVSGFLGGGSALGCEAEKPWPGTVYNKVVAYCYDYTQDAEEPNIISGKGDRLHSGVIKPLTKTLDDTQIKELLGLLTTETTKIQEEEDCFDPHHGFVFYDKDDKPVAWISICIGCNSRVSSPRLPISVLDYEMVEALLKKLGLPIDYENSVYTELYENSKGWRELPRERQTE